jgi:hypothetical protein
VLLRAKTRFCLPKHLTTDLSSSVSVSQLRFTILLSNLSIRSPVFMRSLSEEADAAAAAEQVRVFRCAQSPLFPLLARSQLAVCHLLPPSDRLIAMLPACLYGPVSPAL